MSAEIRRLVDNIRKKIVVLEKTVVKKRDRNKSILNIIFIRSVRYL